jgi:(S)-2-hydroxy-acid oxidase
MITSRIISDSIPHLDAGYKALFLSVDCPYLGKRLNEYRNGFILPEHMCWPNLRSTGRDEFFGAESNMAFGELSPLMVVEEAIASKERDLDASVDWNSIIPWLRSRTSLQIWVKGGTSPRP